MPENDNAEKYLRKARYQRARADREYSRAKREGGLVGQVALEHARNAESCAMAIERIARRFA